MSTQDENRTYELYWWEVVLYKGSPFRITFEQKQKLRAAALDDRKHIPIRDEFGTERLIQLSNVASVEPTLDLVEPPKQLPEPPAEPVSPKTLADFRKKKNQLAKNLAMQDGKADQESRRRQDEHNQKLKAAEKELSDWNKKRKTAEAT